MKGRMRWLNPLGLSTGTASDHKGKVARRTKAGAGVRFPGRGFRRTAENKPSESPVTCSPATI